MIFLSCWFSFFAWIVPTLGCGSVTVKLFVGLLLKLILVTTFHSIFEHSVSSWSMNDASFNLITFCRQNDLCPRQLDGPPPTRMPLPPRGFSLASVEGGFISWNEGNLLRYRLRICSHQMIKVIMLILIHSRKASPSYGHPTQSIPNAYGKSCWWILMFIACTFIIATRPTTTPTLHECLMTFIIHSKE